MPPTEQPQIPVLGYGEAVYGTQSYEGVAERIEIAGHAFIGLGAIVMFAGIALVWFSKRLKGVNK